MGLVLGLDTSYYTTSVALVTREGKPFKDYRQPIKVPEGKRGLAQSAAVFQHIQQLPLLLSAALAEEREIEAVAAVIRPRPAPESYMPVFTVSRGAGEVLAKALKAPVWFLSHQESHLFAGLWGSNFFPARFLAFHLSGGTSELLFVKLNHAAPFLEVRSLGGALDLTAGQFLDRVGVLLGLPFPAGPVLESLASQSTERKVKIPSFVRGFQFSFSGPETRVKQLFQKGVPREELAWAAELCVAKTVEKIIREAVENLGLKKVFLVGGVAANQHLQERLRYRLEHRAVGARLYFPPPLYCTDNACGAAWAVLGPQKSLRPGAGI